MIELHRQRRGRKNMKIRTEHGSQQLGRYPSMVVEDALVNKYEHYAKTSGLATVRSHHTNASKTSDQPMHRCVDVLPMQCCPASLSIRFLTWALA